MAAEYMHIGIPVTNKRPNMVFNEDLKFWVNEDVDGYDYKIEYLKFEEGTPFPEEMHHKPHVAYKVDDMDPYLEDADRVIFEPLRFDEHTRLAFIVKDDAIIELYEEKQLLFLSTSFHKGLSRHYVWKALLRGRQNLNQAIIMPIYSILRTI